VASADDDDAVQRVAEMLGVSTTAARAVIDQQFRSLTRRARERINAEVAELTQKVDGTGR
jgi:Arc/MetJ family transcription regulator